MDSFSDFARKLGGALGEDGELSEVELARAMLHEMASFLYFQTPDVPREYISAFHVWWEEHAAEVIGVSIDDESCRQVATVLERHFSQISTTPQAPPAGTSPQAIANCRFFSAAQDFGGRFRHSPFDLLGEEPDFYSPQRMLDDPTHVDRFLRFLGAEAQYDKRRDYVRNGAQWLIDEYEGEAFSLYEQSGRSVKKLSQKMNVHKLGTGYSAKKTHMFVRDMFDWSVWEPGEDVQALDIAGDANTMRIALRTGILRLAIPTLLPSYFDIYSPQYVAVESGTVRAWRRVWELWAEIPDNHQVPAPAFFDFFVYMLGRTSCRKSTPKCQASSRCNKLGAEDCPAYGSDACEGYCPFSGICPPERIKLQPPKSISILGRTGWQAGMTNEGGGLGITA